MFLKIYQALHSRLRPKDSRNNQNKLIEATLVNYAKMPLPELLQTLHTSGEGLLESDAQERIKQFGLNQIAHERPPSWYALLLRNFANPFIVLLLLLATVSFLIGEIEAVYIITVMVLISVIMRFFQEYRSNQAAEKLKALVSTKATVLRRETETSKSKKEELEIKYLVPGDIIYLSAGDMLPADVRLISAKDVYVSQGSLTGESLPVEKDESLKPAILRILLK